MSIRTIKTKSEWVYQKIRSGVIDGRYKPGERLVIQGLAKKYGISDIPVREALKRLEADGLVRNTPHVGFTVTVPDFESQKEVFEVRLVLEGLAVECATPRMTQTKLKKLEKLQEHMKEVCKSDMVRFAQLNYQFHDTIYAACGNRVLYKFIVEAWAMTPRTRAIFSLFPDRARVSVIEHEKIYLALKAADPKGAKGAMMHHKAEAYELLSGYLKGEKMASGCL